ncbi:MAG: outer membrane protein assembly factor BamA [Deltaproteobacteria bacterium]|nr:MAG: outer membrane protein assembly factor BamA [Deltaproteobacteria bacterium]
MNSCTIKRGVGSVCKIWLAAMTAVLLTVALGQAVTRETLFLPVKVTVSAGSSQPAEELTALVDDFFADSLDTDTFMILGRTQAGNLADYQNAWPPSARQLARIAEDTGTSNIVAGNLTMIGSDFSLDLKMFDAMNPANPVYFSRQGKGMDELEQAAADLSDRMAGYSRQRAVVASIAPAGNKRIDSGAILRRIKTRAGLPYNPALLREDLKAIYKMGYFDDVQIEVADDSLGKKVIFRVVEKPVISSLTYSGHDDLKEQELIDVTGVKEQEILNPVKINQGAEAIKALYKAKGYYDTKVEADISYPDAGEAVVEYKIDEGDKIYIKEIKFEGNKSFDDDELEDQIKTGEKWFMSWLTSSGLLKPDQVRQDAGRLAAFYHNHGFLEARVGEPQIVQEGKWLYVTFKIDEGPRFKIGTVEVKGDLIVDRQELVDLMETRKEEYLSRRTLRDDMLKITDLYAEKGYAFADINPVMNKSAADGRVDLVIEIRKGELVHLNRISIRGNSRTRDNVIRRELTIEEGGIFNSKALRESNRALQRLEFFEEVSVTPEPTLSPGMMDVLIDVKEKSTGSFSIGAGYSSVDHLVFMGQIAESNFLGRGDKLALGANVGGSSSRYNLSYTNPRVNDSQLSWGADLFRSQREYDDYTRESTGGALRIGYPIWEKWRVFGKYGYTDTTLSDVSEDASYLIKKSADINVTSAVKMSLVRDTRNRMFVASEGSKNLVSVKYAGGPFGGDAQFTKVEASSDWYFPLFAGTVFNIRGAAGQVFENEEDKLPVYERFYLGGMNTIRGFEYGKISPRDPVSGERVGGERMWYGNVAWIFPLFKEQGIYGLIFYDTGRVFADDEYEGEGTKRTAGVELKWLSPLGPLRLVWGYNLDPEDDEDQSVWDFTIGGRF